VLKVPNAALRFKPAGQLQGIEGNGTLQKATGDETPVSARGGQPLRERLVQALDLNAEQGAKLDPLLLAQRDKLMAVRELPEAQRAKAMQAARADLRAQIEALLTPEQKTKYAVLAAELAGRAAGGSAVSARGRVWVLDNGKPRAVEVRTGLSDGSSTELMAEGLTEGMEVIVGAQSGASGAPAAKGGAPRFMF
jgi:HlyD family secretion protein